MSFLTKKNKLMNALRNADLDNAFQVRNESADSIMLQSNQNMGNGNCLISLDLSESVFNCIYFCLGQLNNPIKQDTMLSLLNEFNADNLALKFYLDSDNAIMVRITYIATAEKFDGDEYLALLGSLFNSIKDNYLNKIMKVIWS
ncbi:YbjN domain-containing protein [Escherichia coli]